VFFLALMLSFGIPGRWGLWWMSGFGRVNCSANGALRNRKCAGIVDSTLLATCYNNFKSTMPTIRGLSEGYRFYFYSFDCNEPKHVHVQKNKMICEFWLEPVVLSNNYGFSARELNQIRRIILADLPLIIEAWNEHCHG
jgi:hypothetical protein